MEYFDSSLENEGNITMPESALNGFATKADNLPVEGLETEAYLLANKRSDATVKRSVRVSTDPTDDASKIGEAETSISREVDSTLENLKPTKSSIAREPWTEQRATSYFIGDVTEAEEESYFVTGSSYKGSWDALGMAGVGRYIMPHGTAYEGEIRDGMFHGQGSLYWTKSKRLDVVHLRGKLQEHRYTFEDGLAYDDKDWSYCKFPDRRFYESVKKGLRPGGRTLKTGKQPTKVLPSGCYDSGDGVFDPKTLRITSYDDSTKILRVPKKEEYDWIVKNCRKSWTEPTGYRASLNENWSENPPDLPYNIAMSKESPDSWWKRLTTFKREFDTIDEEDDKDISTRNQDEDIPVPELCLCGQYVILGEPCYCAAVPSLSDDEVEMEEINETLKSVNHSSDYLNVESIAGEKRERIRQIGQQSSQVKESFTEVLVGPEVDINNSSIIYKKISEYYFSDEIVENCNDLEKRREGVVEAVQTIAAKAKSKDAVGEEAFQKSPGERHKVKDGKPVDALEDATLKKVAMSDDKIVEGKQKDMLEHEDLQRLVMRKEKEMATRREYTVEEENRKEEEEDMQNSAEKTSRRDEEKVSAILIENEDQENVDEERQEEDGTFHKSAEELVDRPKDVVTKENMRKVDEKSEEAKIDSLESPANENFRQKAVNEDPKEYQRGTLMENHDDAIASISREKVASVTEPEMSNGRRMESERSKLLPKGTTTERDLPYDRTGVKAIRSGVIDTSVIKKTQQENTLLRMVSNKNPEDLAVNVLPAAIAATKKLKNEADDNKLRSDSSERQKLMLNEAEEITDVRREDTQSMRRFYRSIDELKETSKGSEQSKAKKYPEMLSRVSVQAADKLITKEGKFSDPRRDNSPQRKIYEENMQAMKTISVSPSVVALRVIARKNSQSRASTDEEITTAASSISSQDDLPILEKLHRSLAALSSEEQKPTEGKEIIEIYSKFATKEKLKTKCANVWRLSGAAQDYERQTKPTLTAPRCELIEYMRKPCSVRVCKPTLPEVRTSASRCRKEFPFNVPAKPGHSSVERSVYRKKNDHKNSIFN